MKLTILAPNSWRVAASCLLQVCGGCLWCRITPRIAALGGAVVFFWGGIHRGGVAFWSKKRHGGSFRGLRGEDERKVGPRMKKEEMTLR